MLNVDTDRGREKIDRRRNGRRLLAWPEILEVRRLPATITVNSAIDDAPARDDLITLREAILIADGSLSPPSRRPRKPWSPAP